MSTTSKLTISLGEQQLAKLTNATPEIRMRALEQVETRFIRCLQHEETMNLKPVLLLKQLIRWFGFAPPAAADRVLSLMLELLRSEYADVIVQKIPCQRLLAELDKIRKIVGCLQSKRVMELLDDLQSLVALMYNETNSVDSNPTSTASASSSSEMEFSIDKYRFSPTDYEPAWTRASLDDEVTMKTIVDSLTIDNELELLDNLTQLQIKLCDYPVEYLLQPPHIFLHLVHKQGQASDKVLLHVNRSLLVILRLMQRGLNIRSKSIYYSARIECQDSASQQLKFSSALSLLFNACLNKLGPPKLELCRLNWHLLQLIVEMTKTYCQLFAPIPHQTVDQLGLIVHSLINYFGRFGGGSAEELPEMIKELMITRLESFVFNGLLMEAISLNLQSNPKMDKVAAQSLLQSVLTDSAYLSCVPMRMRELSQLNELLLNGIPMEKHQMVRLEQAYTAAVNQLSSKTRLPAKELLKGSQQVCLVLVQLGSEKLLRQLCQAITKCTPFYSTQPKVRQDAELLLDNLLDLPDDRLRGSALRLLKQPIVDHFHAIMNKTNYMMGCSNMELIRQQILGLPLSTNLLRKLFVNGWIPRQSQAGQLQLQQWCIDYLIMILGLAKLIDSKDFTELFQIVIPVLPLIVCRAINYPQLQQLILELLNPDANYLTPAQSMRVNACYLFHPDVKVRKEAQTRLAYTLMRHDPHHRYKPVPDQMNLALIGPDLCVVRPALDYTKLFGERMNLNFMTNLQALMRLLKTPDLKPNIRKSSFTQLNVLLHSWQAVEAFTRMEGFNVIFLTAIHDPLLREKPHITTVQGLDTLQAGASIMCKVLFRSADCRVEFKDDIDILHCLLRNLYLHPLELRMRAELSLCIFQLLFHEHLTPTEQQLQLDVDLSPMIIPVTYEIVHSTRTTIASEGIALQDHLAAKFFGGNLNLAAQHWRLYVAHKICGSSEEMKLSTVQGLDINETIKLKPADVALVQSSLLNIQLQNQLMETGNCSNHEMLHTYVASIQIFLVLLGDEVPPALANNLWKLMHKYLKTTPGNKADRELYTALLDLCISCLRHGLQRVPTGLFTALETDPHHSFYIILRDIESPLNLLQLVTDCLVLLLSDDNYQGDFSWFGKLFMELSALARTHFEKRNLQHVRCLLRVLSKLSEGPLQLDDDKLQIYYQHFVQLSSNLRTSTQTGAQWQRDCLLVICQLQAQTQDPHAIGGKSGQGTKVLRYLLGLCGHSDGEVRTLAWVSLANWVQNSAENIIAILTEFINYLPGGLAASCLSTMMDGHEQMLVREMAGRVFEFLMPHLRAAPCCELFRIHTFLKEAHSALGALQLYPNMKAEGTQNSCEIIGCYVSICIGQVLLQPSWCSTLCEHAFINALSNVMKLKTPEVPRYSRSFLELCAGQIFNLYALCYTHNFEFLQRTICRDTVLLQSFVALIGEVFEQDRIPEHQVIHILKLLMVFCKDQNAYEFLFEQFQEHTELLMNLILNGLKTIYLQRDVQRYSLSLLLLLLSKSQFGKPKPHLLKVLESDVNKNLIMAGSQYNEKEHDMNGEAYSDDKENNLNALNKQLKTCLSLKPAVSQKQKRHNEYSKDNVKPLDIVKGTVFLYHALDQLFQLHYPVKDYYFLQAPSRSHMQLCEVMGNILKLSPQLERNAQDFHLLDYVIQLLETFLDDGSVGNAAVYVRRVGAHKSQDIISNLLVIFHMLMHWHSTPHSVITDPVMASRVVRVILRVWPWLSHSAVLKHMTVLLTSLLTEHSFEMCKQASQMLSGQSHSLLQLMVRVADHETTKREVVPIANTKSNNKNPKVESPIDPALRVMINCCSCTEGRVSLGKMRVLDMFDIILPASNCTTKKVKPEVLTQWLTFWEIFSRYELGYKICHLPALLNTVSTSPPLSKTRQCCLRILRNMCFSNSNRTQLVAMTEFVNLLSDIVSQPVRCFAGAGDGSLESFEEHNLVVLCVWKLFGFNAKNRAELRASTLFKKLSKLSEQMAIVRSKNPQQFKIFPFALELNNKLGKLFNAINR